jgi:salicylate hydroxylase
MALGAWEAVEPACVIPTEIHVRDGRGGGLLQRLRLGKPFEQRFGAPYRVCHRADLLAGLLDAARRTGRIELNPGARVRTATPTADGADLALENGNVVSGAAVIAADGIRSTVRSAVCGQVAPTPRGHAIYRALLPFDRVPPDIEADCVTIWLYPGGHVVHYAVSNWRNFNIVAAIDAGTAETGWNTLADGRGLHDAFADADDSLSNLVRAPTKWLKWQGADLAPLPAWSNGNIVLAGDAAHATLPYLAQGAVMSLEDACVLSAQLKADAAPATAFARYAEARRERCTRIQAESRKLAKVYHARGPVAFARDLVLRFGGPDQLLTRNAWIYNWAPP